jgi:hypothetical protein
MSVWQFIWNAVWREAGNVTRVIQTIAVAVPFIIGLAVGLIGGEWSKEVWPTWVWALITITAMFLALFWGIASRAYALEKANIPKLEIVWGNDRIFFETIENDVGPGIIRVRVGVRNISTVVVDGVELVLANIVSSDGAEVYDIDRLLTSHNIMTRIAINRDDTKYYLIGELGINEFDGPNMAIDSLRLPLKKETTYRIKLKVSSATSPSGRAYFIVGLDDKGGFLFQLERNVK